MSKKNKILTIIFSIISFIVLIFLGFVVAFNITYFDAEVDGESMSPTLNLVDSGEYNRVFVNKFEKGSVNDIVVADISEQANWDKKKGDYMIKRLIGKGGDRIKMERETGGIYNLFVNDKILMSKTYSYVPATFIAYFNYVEENSSDTERIQDGYIILKEGEIFLMGDNWENSYDSFTAGPIKESCLIGRVDIIVKPSDPLFVGAIKGVFKMWFS